MISNSYIIHVVYCICRANDRAPTHHVTSTYMYSTPARLIFFFKLQTVIIANQTVCIIAEMFNEQF